MKKNTNKSGFSLIEMLVAIFVSSIMIVTVVSLFTIVANARNKTRETQQNLENARSAMELMAKTIRMGIDVDIPSEDTINFYNPALGRCISFTLTNKIVQIGDEAKTTDDDNPCQINNATMVYSDLTTAEVDEDGLKFDMTPNPADPDFETIGRVTMLMVIGGKSMQTSVSLRDYTRLYYNKL